MKKKDNENKNKIDLIIKIVLVIIIILLLIHNCSLMRDRDKYKNNQAPNGNVDIIDIKCDSSGQCKPTPTPTNDGKDTNTKKQIISVKFSQESYSVRKGSKITLVAIVKPSELASSKLTWTSGDPSIATVDSNGVVKGLKEGTVVITVTSANGKKTTCTVTVTTNIVNVDSITLDPSSATLNVGDTNQIAAIIKPANATERDVVWSSSDSSIVSVDDKGIIKGLKPGTATITVKTKDGSVVATCTVTVKEVPVESITFDTNNLSVKVGTTAQINATIKPSNATNKELIWTSSDDSIASVDSNGKVTGKKVGSVTITAKSKDGSVQATCTVTVTEADILVEDIILTPEKDVIKNGSSTQINATIVPSNATNKELIWTSSDDSIATVDSNGKVTGKKVGSVTITAKTADGTVQKTVTITVEMNYNDDEVNVFDKDKDPITWNGSSDLNIFTKSIYNVDGIIAPESENTYQFIVRNDTDYRIKYKITFVETNNYDINMKYKLKKNSSYIISEYTRANSITIPEFELDPNEKDTYYLDWKWISSSNDMSIGTNPNANYGLRIEVEAESING